MFSQSKLLRHKNLQYRIKYYEEKKKNLQRNCDNKSI
jgi:hypothetical protein